MTARRCTALLLALAGSAVAVTGPALAADGDNQLTVSLSSVGGTRQFDVLNPDGSVGRSSVALGSTGDQSFRTRVRDENFETLSKRYSVTATMSNLYLKTATGHDVTTKIPSSQLSLAPGVLSADALTATLLPQLSIGGTLENCDELPDTVKTALGIPLDATLTQILTGTLTTLSVTTLCTALGTVGTPASGTVDGVLQTVTASVADVTQLPNALTAGAGSAFTAADYAHDPTAQTDGARSGAPTPTGVSVMEGAPATALPTDLVAALKAALVDVLAPVPLVSSTDTGAETTLARVLATVASSTVQSATSALTTTQQAALLGTLTGTPLDPALASLKGLTSNYYANPTLRATRNAPLPGVYDGTLTLTFVQQ